MILRKAVPVLFDQVVFYKIAGYCRPEVAGDVISGLRAFGVEVVPLTKFGDSTSSRSCIIRPSCFLQMATYCRTEVAGDVISGQRAFGVEVVPLTKFGDPSSNRLATIHKRGGRTDGRTCS